MKLSDIAPTAISSETIELRGHQVDIYPLSIADIVAAARKNPGLLNLFFSGEADDEKRGKAIVSAILSIDRETVLGVLAAATGATAEQVAAFKLSAVEEARILMKAAEVSMPESEVEKIKAGAQTMAARLGGDATATGRD